MCRSWTRAETGSPCGKHKGFLSKVVCWKMSLPTMSSCFCKEKAGWGKPHINFTHLYALNKSTKYKLYTLNRPEIVYPFKLFLAPETIMKIFGPWDLPEMLSNNVQPGSFRGGPGAGDIICLVKRHISDGQLSQPPLLVLPEDRTARANWNVRTKYLRLHLSSFSNYVFTLFPNHALAIFRSHFLPVFPNHYVFRSLKAPKQPYRCLQRSMFAIGKRHSCCLWATIFTVCPISQGQCVQTMPCCSTEDCFVWYCLLPNRQLAVRPGGIPIVSKSEMNAYLSQNGV